MGALPKLHLRLVERTAEGDIFLGRGDFTFAAAMSMSEEHEDWGTAVPDTIEAFRSMNLRARKAALEGYLYSPDLPKAFNAFKSDVEAIGGAKLLTFHLSVLDAASKVKRQAQWLLKTVMDAVVIDHGDEEYFSHPLTGEIFPISDDEKLDGIPFGFSVVRAQFKGIDADALLDFINESEDSTAVSYLEFSIRKPEQWFKDVEGLERDIAAYRSDKDYHSFKEAINHWNAKQDVRPVMGDTTAILMFSQHSDHQSSIDWCIDHAEMASDLVDGILKGFDR